MTEYYNLFKANFNRIMYAYLKQPELEQTNANIYFVCTVNVFTEIIKKVDIQLIQFLPFHTFQIAYFYLAYFP